VSTCRRRASKHCRRHRTAKIATSAITRLYAESAGSGSVWPDERNSRAVIGAFVEHSVRRRHSVVVLARKPSKAGKRRVKKTLGEKARRGSSIQMITVLSAGLWGLIYSQYQFEILNWFLIENVSTGDHCRN
jgi:hypothetical protein